MDMHQSFMHPAVKVMAKIALAVASGALVALSSDSSARSLSASFSTVFRRSSNQVIDRLSRLAKLWLNVDFAVPQSPALARLRAAVIHAMM